MSQQPATRLWPTPPRQQRPTNDSDRPYDRAVTDAPMPSPPFPSPDDAVLRVIVGNAITAVESGETDVRGAILHAAVHAWYEGHIQGEDSCPGCDFRGQLPKGSNRS